MHASCTLLLENHSSFEEKNVRLNIRIFERRFISKSFTSPLPTGCSNGNQRSWRHPEASATKSTIAGVRGKDLGPVVSRRRAKNFAEIFPSYKKTKKPKKRPLKPVWTPVAIFWSLGVCI